MSSWPRIRSFRALIVILAAIFCSPLSAGALAQDLTPQQYANQCYQPQSDVELKISYCTKAIESGQLSVISLATTYVNRGLAFFTKGDLERAMADYDSAIQAKPDHAQAYVVRGNLFREKGEESKALADYERAIAIPVHPGNAGETLDRARAYMDKGDFNAALIDLNEVNRLNPKIREVYLSRANIYKKRRDFKAAITEYDAQLKLNPKDAATLELRAISYLNATDFEHALADCDAAINVNQFVASYYDTRALVQRLIGNQDVAAIADLTRAIQLEPTLGTRYIRRAEAYRAKGDWKNAMTDYDHAIQVEPNRAVRWDARAAEREYEGDFAGALADMDEAIRIEPNNADMREGRAWVLLDTGRTEEALAGFADAIRIDPKAGSRLSTRAYALTEIGRFDEALADYGRAEQLEPTQGVFLAQRMSVYLLRGQPLSALPDIDRSMIVEPGYADGRYLRGFALLAALQPDEAIRDFNAYLAQRPEGRLGFNGRGFGKMMKGDFAGAADDFRKSVELNLLDSGPILWLHVANERLGKDDHEELAKYASRVDPRGWPGPAVRFALGQLPLDEMLAAANSPSELKTREQQVDAYYYAGEYYLSIHDTANAQKMFLEATSRNERDKIEDLAARGELAALNH